MQQHVHRSDAQHGVVKVESVAHVVVQVFGGCAGVDTCGVVVTRQTYLLWSLGDSNS